MKKMITNRSSKKRINALILILAIFFAEMGSVWGQKRNEKDNSKIIKPVESIANEKELWKKEPYGNYDMSSELLLNITDASGKLVGNQALKMNEGMNLFVINQELTPGIYFLTISNGSKSTPVLRHAVK